MRKVIMFNRVTADGYFAGPDGNLDGVVPDTELDRPAAEAIKEGGVDTILFGRRTYELFERSGRTPSTIPLLRPTPMLPVDYPRKCAPWPSC